MFVMSLLIEKSNMITIAQWQANKRTMQRDTEREIEKKCEFYSHLPIYFICSHNFQFTNSYDLHFMVMAHLPQINLLRDWPDCAILSKRSLLSPTTSPPSSPHPTEIKRRVDSISFSKWMIIFNVLYLFCVDVPCYVCSWIGFSDGTNGFEAFVDTDDFLIDL